jgi:anti-sigma regulatory factor (Ser/Thr protein kinase)
VGRDDLVASAAYQPEPTAVAAARRFVRATLQSWVVAGASAGGSGLVDDAVLLTSELVTNAVVHAGTPVQVTCKVTDGEVEVVVSDAHPDRLVPEPAENTRGAAERTSGRGLLLPAALASAWGVTYGQAAKAVWFRLAAAAAEGWHHGLAVAPDVLTAPTGTPGFGELLAGVAESARAAVAADGSFVLLADEDGDLRLQAAAGDMPAAEVPEHNPGARPDRGRAVTTRAPPGPAPSVLTVPFIVDGRVTGLLATVAARPGTFGDGDAAKLQRLADTSGPRLQRAWLDELERVRRGRIAALAQTRALLTGRLSRPEIMTLTGIAAVPGLAPWCALLLPDADGALRPAHVRHVDEAVGGALAGLLGRGLETAPPAPPARYPGDGSGWRWRLPEAPPGGAPAAAGAAGTGAAWCFPLGQPGDAGGLLVIGGNRGGRLSREVAALASDLACRAGLALAGSGLVAAPRR